MTAGTDVQHPRVVRMLDGRPVDGDVLAGCETIRLEGVDGDEETNTVTYWYTTKEEA